MADTTIEWTATQLPDGSLLPGYSFNPWWGCTHDGPECDHCYAEAFAKRTGHAVWGHQSPRRFFGDDYWAAPLRWQKEAARTGIGRKVFCASMADIGERLPGDVGAQMDRERGRLTELIAKTPDLTWLVLTKRPQNIPFLFPEWESGAPKNVWMGTTAGNQEGVDKRVKFLLRIPAVLHFLSVEPMLGPIDLRKYLDVGGICECEHDAPKGDRCEGKGRKGWIRCNAGLRRIRWVLCGGESGGGARPFDLAWARALRDQCAATRGWGQTPNPTHFLMKQLGARVVGGDPGLVPIRSRKGNGLDEFPPDLRMRQFPEAR